MIHLCLIVSLLTAQPYQFDDVGYEYYKSIASNNLFRPLGWTVPDRSPKYELIATIISEDYIKAYVRETRNGRDYFVGIGDNVGSSVVKEIHRGLVRLDEEDIKGETFGFLNTTVTRRSTARKGNSTATSGGTSTKVTEDKKEDSGTRQRTRSRRMRGGGQWQAQIEQFQNASPEDRQKMIQEFRQMRGNRRGRGD